jgi:hypothetical protein
VTLDHTHDPRHERGRPALSGPARNLKLRETAIPTITLERGVELLIGDLMDHADALSAASMEPTVDWRIGATEGVVA